MELQKFFEAWIDSIRAIVGLDISPEQGDLATSLPGWRVRDIIAHLVHLEEVLAFGESDSEPGVDGQLRGAVSADYTQGGVDALKTVPLHELIERLQVAVSARAKQLDPLPADASALPDRRPGGIDWNWSTMLRNRVIDAWMHEQDLRRAIGAPDRLDAAGAAITLQSFASALPFIVGKRAQVSPAHPVQFEIDGPYAFTRTIAVDDTGRARDTEAAPLTTIAMSSGAFLRLAGGREPVKAFDVRVSGDTEVASRVLQSLAVTP